MRQTEIYELECHKCKSHVELKTTDVRDGAGCCPGCGAALRIEWRAGN